MIIRSASVAIFLSLAACGGGTTATDPEPDAGPDPISFDSFADGEAIATEIAATNTELGLMNPADLRQSGSARYQGTAEISSTAGLNAIGVASVTVVFVDDTVAGSASDFIDDTDTPVDGSLELTEGSFDRSGGAGGNISATVTGNFDGATYILLPSELSGAFYGDAEGIMIEGAASGLVGSDPTTYDISIITELAE